LFVFLQNDDSINVLDSSHRQHNASNSSMSVDSFPYTSMLLRSVLTDCEMDDNAQNILEEHVLRVWDRSNGPTPGGGFSPGLRTPIQHRSSGGSRCAGSGASGGPSARVVSSSSAGSKPFSHRIRDEGVASSYHDDRLHGTIAQQQQRGGASTHHGHRHQPQSVSSSAMGAKESSSLQRQLRSHVVLSNADHEFAKRPNARRSLDAVHGGGVVSSASRPTAQDLQAGHIPEVTSER
jgi:hypothetical protein